MKYFKSLAITTMALTGFVALGAGITQAATPTNGTNPMNKLVAAIAQKFNLSQTDVQKVFDEQRTQMDTERQHEQQARFKTQLDAAVTSGKLTQTQANLLTAKQTEVKSFMDTLKDKTPEERNAAMKTQLEALKTWATTNNIPTEFSSFLGGHGGFGGPRGEDFGGRRQDPKERLTQAVTAGKLTQAQADAITAKLTEQKTFLETLKGKTRDERDAAIKTQQETLKTWATTNNIPSEYVLMPAGGEHRGPGGMMGGKMGGKGRGGANLQAAPAPSSP